jgi:hypothetical protein
MRFVSERPRRSSPPDHERVLGSGVIERGRQSRSLGLRPTHGVGEDAVAAGGVEGIPLQGQVLVVGGDAGIANVHTPIVSKVSAECKEQNGDFETRF